MILFPFKFYCFLPSWKQCLALLLWGNQQTQDRFFAYYFRHKQGVLWSWGHEGDRTLLYGQCVWHQKIIAWPQDSDITAVHEAWKLFLKRSRKFSLVCETFKKISPICKCNWIDLTRYKSPNEHSLCVFHYFWFYGFSF